MSSGGVVLAVQHTPCYCPRGPALPCSRGACALLAPSKGASCTGEVKFVHALPSADQTGSSSCGAKHASSEAAGQGTATTTHQKASLKLRAGHARAWPCRGCRAHACCTACGTTWQATCLAGHCTRTCTPLLMKPMGAPGWAARSTPRKRSNACVAAMMHLEAAGLHSCSGQWPLAYLLACGSACRPQALLERAPLRPAQRASPSAAPACAATLWTSTASSR